jgi:hypothetical protein
MPLIARLSEPIVTCSTAMIMYEEVVAEIGSETMAWEKGWKPWSETCGKERCKGS